MLQSQFAWCSILSRLRCSYSEHSLPNSFGTRRFAWPDVQDSWPPFSSGCDFPCGDPIELWSTRESHHALAPPPHVSHHALAATAATASRRRASWSKRPHSAGSSAWATAVIRYSRRLDPQRLPVVAHVRYLPALPRRGCQKDRRIEGHDTRYTVRSSNRPTSTRGHHHADHRHALQMVHACQAGKDVYVEKPGHKCVAEGRNMYAAEKHHRVVQVGLRRRSSNSFRGGRRSHPKRRASASDGCPSSTCRTSVRRGSVTRLTNRLRPTSIGIPGSGRLHRRAYDPNRTCYRFRWFYDYPAGSSPTCRRVHCSTSSHSALGEQATTPRGKTLGGRFALADNREIPNTLEGHIGNTPAGLWLRSRDSMPRRLRRTA